MTRNRRPPPKTRVIGYAFEGLEDVDPAERLLRAGIVAQTVTQFDTGSGGFIWWNGPPGEAMRVLRDQIAAMPGARPVRRG